MSFTQGSCHRKKSTSNGGTRHRAPRSSSDLSYVYLPAFSVLDSPITMRIFVLATAARLVTGLSVEQWRSLSVYQIMTDRFAKSHPHSTNCALESYCGGSWQGISNHLDYVQGMGFDAIWVSRVTSRSIYANCCLVDLPCRSEYTS